MRDMKIKLREVSEWKQEFFLWTNKNKQKEHQQYKYMCIYTIYDDIWWLNEKKNICYVILYFCFVFCNATRGKHKKIHKLPFITDHHAMSNRWLWLSFFCRRYLSNLWSSWTSLMSQLSCILSSHLEWYVFEMFEIFRWSHFKIHKIYR